MCELLGMDCNVPTDIVFSFRGLVRRGGGTGPHRDGWGLSLYEGHDTRIFKEPDPAVGSELARYLRENPIKTKIAIAHIRQRTAGSVRLANAHPFTRELWGRTWTFAHNGTVRAVKSWPLRRFLPVGTTDSEHAFCALMDRLAARFRTYPEDPRVVARSIARFGREVAALGTFNFLLSDGTFLYARCHTNLHHIVRKHPFSRATLSDEDVTIDFSRVTTPRDRVAVIATRPLTRDETWTKGRPHTLWVFSAGALRAELPS